MFANNELLTMTLIIARDTNRVPQNRKKQVWLRSLNEESTDFIRLRRSDCNKIFNRAIHGKTSKYNAVVLSERAQCFCYFACLKVLR